MKILCLPGTFTTASSRFRILQFVQPLKSLGHEVDVRVTTPDRSSCGGNRYVSHLKITSISRVLSALWMIRDARNYDVIFMNRDIVPELWAGFIEKWLYQINNRSVFDFDDAIFSGARDKKLKKIFPFFSHITPGNKYLAEYAGQLNSNITVIPTVVNSKIYTPLKERQPGRIRIGWSGSDNTLQYSLPVFEPFIDQLAEKEDFEFVLISNTYPKVNWKKVKLEISPMVS